MKLKHRKGCYSSYDQEEHGPKLSVVLYISRLPQLAEMHSAIFWDENEFSMIRCSAVHKETVKQKARIEKEFSLTDLLLNLDNFLLDSWISCVGNLKRHITGTVFSMVLRFGLSASIVLSDEDNQLSEVTADRDYSPGDEVQIQMDVPSDYPLRNMKLELLQSHYTMKCQYLSLFL
uniref:Uncharacterized protein n=1 Tax=Brassica oleracea TaxID=3712 RepID=A0A3P6FY04_BRAOL|nr:unnamed protein product [Brassica oleracea]